jgi:hypothetical protein
MNRALIAAFVLAAPVLGLVSWAATAESASPPATSASAAPSASAPSPLSAEDVPRERSVVPSAKEWDGARPIAVEGPTSCTVRMVREWLWIRCDKHFAASLVAGDPKDVTIRSVGELFSWDPVNGELKDSYIEAVLPVERGAARIVTFLDPNGGGGDWGPGIPGEGATFHVWWREGATAPHVVATHPRP